MTKILYDLFPAFVAVAPPNLDVELSEMSSAPPTVGTYQVHSCRIIISEDRIIIAKDSPSGPMPVFSDELEPGSFKKAANRSLDSFAATKSGKKLAFKKDDSCGCGSRLRTWNPYPIVNSKNDPTE